MEENLSMDEKQQQAEGKVVMINRPPDRKQSAEKLWAFIAIDREGNESPCGAFNGAGWNMMASSKWSEVEKMLPMARKMAQQARANGLRIVLRQYAECQDLETL